MLKIGREIKEEHIKAQSFLSLSIIHSRRTGDIKKAESFSEESLVIARNIDDLYLISINLVHLAVLKLYFDNKNFEEAEYILLEANKISKDCGYSMNMFPIRLNLGYLYMETEKFQSAINIYKEYINEKEKPGAEFFMKDLLAGFARIFFKRNEFSQSVKYFGFLESISNDVKYKAPSKVLALKDEEKKIILEKLTEDEYNRSWNEGMELKIDEVIDFCSNIGE